MKKFIELLTDQEFDAESGLYNYDARMYDPVIGRFISPDNVIPDQYNPQSLNRYSYCLNNPLIYTDPTGHFYDLDEYTLPTIYVWATPLYEWLFKIRNNNIMSWNLMMLLAGPAIANAMPSTTGATKGKGPKGFNYHSNSRNGIKTDEYNTANSFAAKYDSNGKFLVMVHGDKKGIYEPYFGERIPIDNAFKKEMVDAGWTEGTPVFLMACYGGISAAQELSNLLGVDVLAFDGIVELRSDGTVGFYEPLDTDPSKPDYSKPQGEPYTVPPNNKTTGG